MGDLELYSWLYNKGIELLARREHGRAELKTKFRHKSAVSKQWRDEPLELLEAAMEQALDKLEGFGYLNDERFVQAYVSGRLNKGYGRSRIKLELKQKGIGDILIEQHIDYCDEEPIEGSPIYRVWQKKFKVLAGEPKGHAKQQRFLMYRGFNMAEISRLFDYLDVFFEGDS